MLNSRKWVVVVFWSLGLLFFSQCEKFKTPLELRWKTYCEKVDFKRTPRYAETIKFCKRLARVSRYVSFKSFGISPQGRKLPLLIVDFDRCFSPLRQRRTGKAVLLVQACIHPGECDGKDAGLMFIRDVVIFKKYRNLFENVTLLFIPIFNVDGHERFGPYNRINQNGPEEMGWRTTAQNLNLNRDFLKADAPEMQAWLKLFSSWLPDFIVDIHVTDGADYQYVITYGMETREVLEEPLSKWSKDIFLPEFKSLMKQRGYPTITYVMPRKWGDITSGIVCGVMPPRLSNGYGIVQNRPVLLIENHMLKSYKERVLATYEMLKCVLEIVNKEYKSLKEAVQLSDKRSSTIKPKETYYLRYQVDFSDSTMIEFLGKKFHYEQSEISGSKYIVWEDDPCVYHIPLFDKIKPVDSIKVPYAYLIPPEWSNVTKKLTLHGVNVKFLEKEITIPVHVYKFSNVKWREKPYEGRHRVSFSAVDTVVTRTFPARTAVIFLNQRTSKLIIHALEPSGPDSFLRWGFFDVIFEQKEYAERYVLEKLAAEMAKKNPDVYKEFTRKLRKDPSFAADPWKRLQFFYERSPYWDENLNIYPIGRIFDPIPLPL